MVHIAYWLSHPYSLRVLLNFMKPSCFDDGKQNIIISRLYILHLYGIFKGTVYSQNLSAIGAMGSYGARDI
jgi:hypothetical protein